MTEHFCIFPSFSIRQGDATRPPHLAVSQVVDLLANVSDVGFGLVVCGAAGDVAVGLGQTQDRALQTDVDGVGQGGMVHLWVVAVDLIHPPLSDLSSGGERRRSQNLLSQLTYTHLTHIFEDSVVVFPVVEALFGFWCKANEEKFVPPDAALHLSAPGSVSHLCLSCCPLPLSSFSLEHLCPQGVRLSCATACYPL